MKYDCKKSITLLLILAALFLTSCDSENNFNFPNEAEYNDFKSTWVEPENYSFELFLYKDDQDFVFSNSEVECLIFYLIKIVKQEGQLKFYLNNCYYSEGVHRFYDTDSYPFNGFDHEISREELLAAAGNEYYLESITDCFTFVDSFISKYMQLNCIQRVEFSTASNDENFVYPNFLHVKNFKRKFIIIDNENELVIQIFNFKKLDQVE